jgi:hypothetical protein
MVYWLKQSRLVWLAVGICSGLLLGGLVPHTPLHAMCNERSDDFAIATGAVDETTEAIFFLDFLTGDLKAAVVGGPRRTFCAYYGKNIRNDLGLDTGKTPNYRMITGLSSNLRGMTGRARPSTGLVFITNCSTCRTGAYGLLWDSNAMNAGKTVSNGTILLLGVVPFRDTGAIQPGAPTR